MKTRVLNNLIMFMLVSSTGGLLFVFNRNIAFLILVSTVISSLFFLQNRIKNTTFYSSLLVLFVLFSLFAINFTLATNLQSLTKYLFFGVTIFTSVLVLFYYNNQESKTVFINSLYFILKLVLFHALFSFIAYFFVIDNLFLISSEYHETLTFNYLFHYSLKGGAAIIHLFGFDFPRNAGMFWEAGILQGYLNLLFFLEISIFKRNRKLLALIILAILTTYSTTGLLFLLIQIVYFSFKSLKSNIKITLLIIPLCLIFNININEKIYGEGQSSFQKRLFDLTQPFFIAVENPLTGIGLDLDRFQEKREDFYISSDLNSSLNKIGINQKIETSSKGSTNSVMYILAGMGFPIAFLLIYMFTKQQIIRNDRLMWFILTFGFVMSEPLLLRPFFFIFIVSGFYQLFYKIVSHKKLLS